MKKNLNIHLCAFAVLFLVGINAGAVGFSNLTQTELQGIAKEVGAGFLHSSLTPASKSDHDFQVGIISSGASSDTLKSLIGRYDSNSNFNTIPRASLLGAMKLGSQFSIELLVLPPLTVTEIKFDSQSIGLKWFGSEVFPASFDWSVRSFVGRTGISWSQTISSVNTSMTYSQLYWGVIAEASKKFGYFEPYLNLGLAFNHGEMTSAGASIFSSAYTTSSKSSESVTGLIFASGVSAEFSLVNFAIEFGSAYQTFNSAIKASVLF
jgi:hypothetical protein